VIATIPSASLLGVEGRPVFVEVHVGNGLPSFTVVGLPDAACRESRDRVRSAFVSSGLRFPPRRVTVNLAPSGERKGGPGLDLPIAVGLLVADGQLAPTAVEGCGFIGELGLDGSVRPVSGMVPMAAAVGAPALVVPAPSAPQASLLGRHTVRAVDDLAGLVAVLSGKAEWARSGHGEWGRSGKGSGGRSSPTSPAAPALAELDLADVRGQRLGRWALEVAAAGGHHLLLVGPPGAGKTMLARRLPGLLPRLAREQALEAMRVHSAAGLGWPGSALMTRPPFRSPHHGASVVSLIGGGTAAMRPGEISLAHGGVLFLDEMGEFPTVALDALRQPLEEGIVVVCRARATVTFPARFILVGAMNPCPCGEGATPGSCRCTPAARARYAKRLSGPLLDRFDLRVPVGRPAVEELLGGPTGEPSAVVAERVALARQRAAARGVIANAYLSPEALDRLAPLSGAAESLLERRLRAGLLSARGLHRVRRVARTLADLAGAGDTLDVEHVAGALELRVGLSFLSPVAA
jgi:magnesium chelatase family protein